MSIPEFKAWPKTPRLFRTPQQKKDMSPCVTITEKIDGTNGCIVVNEYGEVWAQSRKRFVTPEDDNQGFGAWAFENADLLADTLGPGYHYGEWWGYKIMRTYGLKERRFSLFNTDRWEGALSEKDFGLDVVPIITELYDFSCESIEETMDCLLEHGSYAAPGFMNPEGLMLYHHASKQIFKYPAPFNGKCSDCRMTAGHKMDCERNRVSE